MAIGDKSSSVRNWIDRFVSSVIIKAHGAVRDRQWILFGVGLFEGQGKGRLELTSEYLLPVASINLWLVGSYSI